MNIEIKSAYQFESSTSTQIRRQVNTMREEVTWGASGSFLGGQWLIKPSATVNMPHDLFDYPTMSAQVTRRANGAGAYELNIGALHVDFRQSKSAEDALEGLLEVLDFYREAVQELAREIKREVAAN